MKSSVHSIHSPYLRLPKCFFRPRAMLPTLPLTCSPAEFAAAYAKTRAVVLRGGAQYDDKQADRFGLAQLRTLPAHAELMRDAAASFTVENAPLCAEDSRAKKRKRSNETREVLGPQTAEELLEGPCLPEGTWYASCIVQHEPKALEALLHEVPMATPPCLSDEMATHSRAIWIFVGRNGSTSTLAGRPEHTDSVRHETWHFQAEGTKEWRLRPTDELVAACPRTGGPVACTVLCQPGDVLILSTRDWWHATSIPPQVSVPAPSSPTYCATPTVEDGLTSAARYWQVGSEFSLSYAREFRLQRGSTEGGDMPGGLTGSDGVDGLGGGDELEMGNVERLTAAMPIAKGGLVLREAEMPDCHLPSGAACNVKVHEDEETGERLLIATRDIASGETLMLAPEEEDGEEEEDDGEEEDEEDEGEEEEAAVVQCDRKDCRRELSDMTATVFTTRFGQDYCESCAAKFPDSRRAGMRKMTVAERLAEVA